jgi:hypothetical protein
MKRVQLSTSIQFLALLVALAIFPLSLTAQTQEPTPPTPYDDGLDPAQNAPPFYFTSTLGVTNKPTQNREAFTSVSLSDESQTQGASTSANVSCQVAGNALFSRSKKGGYGKVTIEYRHSNDAQS